MRRAIGNFGIIRSRITQIMGTFRTHFSPQHQHSDIGKGVFVQSPPKSRLAPFPYPVLMRVSSTRGAARRHASPCSGMLRRVLLPSTRWARASPDEACPPAGGAGVLRGMHSRGAGANSAFKLPVRCWGSRNRSNVTAKPVGTISAIGRASRCSLRWRS
jgi:hypothetical protein